MTEHRHSFILHENNSDGYYLNSSTDKPKQALSDSTNIHSKNCHMSSRVNNLSDRHLRPRASIRRCKDTTKRRHQHSNDKIATMDTTNLLTDIQIYQQQQRALYNARQTPLIPFITDMDFSPLVESFEAQDNLLIDILSLLKKSNEECSFFEQFKI